MQKKYEKPFFIEYHDPTFGTTERQVLIRETKNEFYYITPLIYHFVEKFQLTGEAYKIKTWSLPKSWVNYKIISSFTYSENMIPTFIREYEQKITPILVNNIEHFNFIIEFLSFIDNRLDIDKFPEKFLFSIRWVEDKMPKELIKTLIHLILEDKNLHNYFSQNHLVFLMERNYTHYYEEFL